MKPLLLLGEAWGANEVRLSAGFVGAGGIGQELAAAFELFQYARAATIILAIFAIVLFMEFVTSELRRGVG